MPDRDDGPAKERKPLSASFENARPSLAEARRSSDKAHRLIRWLRDHRNLTQAKIGVELALDQTNVGRKLTSGGFDKDQLTIILDYAEKNELIQPTWLGEAAFIPHSLFYSMMNFFELKPHDQDNARAQLTGTYRLFRHSTEWDKDFVFGRLDITEDAEHPDDDASHTTALCVTIRQVRKKTRNQRGTDERLDGYIFKMRTGYVMLVKERGMLSNNFRCTVFNEGRIDEVGKRVDGTSVFPADTIHLVHAKGFAVGMDAGEIFFSPVYIDLVDSEREVEELDGQIDLCLEGENIPRRVATWLQGYKRELLK